MAKGFPFESGDFARNVKIANLANICQGVSKNSNEMTKWPFESGDFDENGEICVNDEYGKHLLKS